MKRKVLATVLTLLMVISMFPVTALAAEFSDMPNDWSRPALENAVANGLLAGADGKLMPAQNLSRAQMAAVINRAFGAAKKASLSGYTDVAAGAWYFDDMAKAVQMKTFVGSGGKLNPSGNITREEVFIVLARAFKLSGGNQNSLDKFSDKSDISSWATDSVASLVEASYIAGSNGKVNPKQYITRAEFAQIMYNLLKNYIKTAGTCTTVSKGNVMINVPDVTLKNVTINGDLIIGDGVGDGDVTLDNVRITGRTVIRGGGVNSIRIIGGSEVGNVIITKVDGKVRVITEDGSTVEVIYVDDGNDDVIIEGTVGSIEVATSDVPVILQNADVGSVTVSASNSNVTIDQDSTVGTVTVSESAQGTNLSVAGTVTTIDTDAPETGITVSGTVTNVTVGESADGSSIGGEGTVKNASIEGNNTSVDTIGTSVDVGESVSGTTSGGQEVSGGTSGTTSSDGGVTPPPVVIGGGGGGSSAVAVNSITVTGAAGATSVVYGSTLQMSAAVTPINATDKTITWSVTSGTGTATISAGGLLTATGVGTVTVKATNTVSGVSGNLVVTITAKTITVENISAIDANTVIFNSIEVDSIKIDNVAVAVTGTVAPYAEYADGTYTVNLDTPLTVGDHTITLTKSGYVTKTVTVSFVGKIEQDPGKTGGAATVAVAGKTIIFGGEIAFYGADEELERAQGHRVGVKVTAPAGMTNVNGTATLTIGDTTYAADENWMDGGNYFYYYPLVTEAGQEFTFTVKWDGTDASADEFTIKIDDNATLEGEMAEPNNDIDHAITITVDADAQTHWIYPNTDVDWFKFEVQAGTTYKIQTSNLYPDYDDNMSYEVDTAIYLYDQDGCTLLDIDDDDYSDPDYGYGSRIDYTFEESGTYYLKVVDYNNSDFNSYDDEIYVGQYDIAVTQIVRTESPTILSAVSDDGSAVVSGTSEAGAFIVLSIIEGDYEGAKYYLSADDSGNWEFTELPLEVGDIVSVTAQAENKAVSMETTAEVTAEEDQAAVNAVAAGITDIENPAQDATILTLPTVPEEYSIAIKSSSNIGWVTTDGTVIPQIYDCAVRLVLTVTNLSTGKYSDTGLIQIIVPKSSVGDQIGKIAASALGTINVGDAQSILEKAQALISPGYTVSVKVADGTCINASGVAIAAGNGSITFTVTQDAGIINPADTAGLSIIVNAAPDTTAPTLTSVTPAEGNVVLASGEHFILTVDAFDAGTLAELEIDHNMSSTLPEFSVYASEENPYGTEEDKTQFEAMGVLVTYNAADQKWVIDFGDTATDAFVANSGITFYIVIKDAAGNRFGSMSPTTPENTVAYTLTRLEYNGSVSGVINTTELGVVSGTLTGAYNVTVTGQVTGYVDNRATFTGTVSGGITGDITATINSNGIDTLSGIITNTGAEEPVRIIGTFPKSGIDGDFIGEIITGPEPTYVESMTIQTEGGVNTVAVDDTLQMTVEVSPTGTLSDVCWSVWTSEGVSTDIAIIDQDGVLTGVQVGTVIVVAKALDGSLVDAIRTITVVAPVMLTHSGIDTGYSSIQAAIDDATSGDTINVATGEYIENLTIDKPVTIIGADKNTTIIDGSSTGVVVTITASNVTIKGFTIRNSGTDINTCAGIGLVGVTTSVTGSTIENNIITNNVTGVAVMGASVSTIKDNSITNSARYGIVLEVSPFNSALYSTSNSISGNTMIANARDGIYVGEDCNGNTITNNLISGATGTIEGDFEGNGIYFWKSASNTVTGNTISFNTLGYGIEMMGSKDNIITGNEITGNLDGLHIRNINEIAYPGYSIRNNTISGNRIYDNTRVNLYTNPNFDFNVENNWWGSADRATIVSKIASWNGDGAEVVEPGTIIYIDFEPWCTDESCTATTNLSPITEIGLIAGIAKVGELLTAGALTPAEATVNYQWTICDTEDGTYENITGATNNTYTPVAGDENKFIKVTVTATGSYSGTVTSAATAAVLVSDD